MTVATIKETLSSAIRKHQAGQLDEAQAFYRDVLARQPEHPDAMHLLGVLLAQIGQRDQAISLIRRAISIKRNVVDYHRNLGSILLGAGQPDAAESAFRAGLVLRPTMADLHANLGDSLRMQDKFPAAIVACRQAISLDSNSAIAWNSLAAALLAAREFEEAKSAAQKAISLNPNFGHAYLNLGNVLISQGDTPESIDAFRKAVELLPNDAEALNSLGGALQYRGYVDESIAMAQKALLIQPKLVSAYINLSNAFRDNQRTAEAIAMARKALELRPGIPEGMNNLSIALKADGQFHEALKVFHQMLDENPQFVGAWTEVAGTLMDVGRFEESYATFKKALLLNPQDAGPHSTFLFASHAFPQISPQELFQLHLDYDRKHIQPLAKHIHPHHNNRNADRRLNIGYVSSDMRHHSVAYFLVPLLEGHDHSRVHVTGYFTSHSPDAMTARIKSFTDRWHNMAAISDQRIADQIRADQIDILIDLGGHTGGAKLTLFGRKPAPVQVTYLGYPDTTGVSTIDWRLSDALADPPGLTDSITTEKIYRLPHGAWCYAPLSGSPPIPDPPFEKNEFVTFGTFAPFHKINAPTIRLWAEILKQVPGSKFLMKNRGVCDSNLRAQTESHFAEFGIEPARLEFVQWIGSSAEHLKIYDRVDIILDTFPYHGTTNFCEAMWMSVPVVCKAGVTHASRVGVSLLTSVGLPDLVGNTDEQYTQRAVDLAHDSQRLGHLRRNLREMMRNSPLTDGKTFARDVEDAYQDMWRQWCAKMG